MQCEWGMLFCVLAGASLLGTPSGWPQQLWNEQQQKHKLQRLQHMYSCFWSNELSAISLLSVHQYFTELVLTRGETVTEHQNGLLGISRASSCWAHSLWGQGCFVHTAAIERWSFSEEGVLNGAKEIHTERGTSE